MSATSIELFDCAPLSARISQRQCAVNREREVTACGRCAGLGALVESVTGKEETKKPWGRTGKDYSEKGGKSKAKRALNKAIDQDRILGGALPVEMLEACEPRILRVDFELDEVGDLEMMQRAEQVANANGITLGDELLCRLRITESLL